MVICHFAAIVVEWRPEWEKELWLLFFKRTFRKLILTSETFNIASADERWGFIFVGLLMELHVLISSST